MDGVLLRSMHLHCRAWHRAANSLGLRVDRQLILQHEGEPGATTARWLAPPRYRQELLARKEHYFQRFKRSVRPYAGVASLLRRAARSRLKLGLVTGTSRGEIQAALPSRLLRVFHASVAGNEVRHGKPHPEAYRKICRLLRVKPAEVLVVENAPFGIQAARRARIGTIIALSTTIPRRQLRAAHHVFHSIRDVESWCRQTKALTRTLSLHALQTLWQGSGVHTCG